MSPKAKRDIMGIFFSWRAGSARGFGVFVFGVWVFGFGFFVWFYEISNWGCICEKIKKLIYRQAFGPVQLLALRGKFRHM
jgi:hypothetical protein